MIVEILIIVGVVVLFVGSTLLNSKVKPPEGCEVPAGCGSCTTTSCSIKSVIQNTQAVEDKKNELKAYLRSVEEQEKDNKSV